MNRVLQWLAIVAIVIVGCIISTVGLCLVCALLAYPHQLSRIEAMREGRELDLKIALKIQEINHKDFLDRIRKSRR